MILIGGNGDVSSDAAVVCCFYGSCFIGMYWGGFGLCSGRLAMAELMLPIIYKNCEDYGYHIPDEKVNIGIHFNREVMQWAALGTIDLLFAAVASGNMFAEWLTIKTMIFLFLLLWIVAPTAQILSSEFVDLKLLADEDLTHLAKEKEKARLRRAELWMEYMADILADVYNSDSEFSDLSDL